MTPESLFGPTGQITWWQECARAALIFVYGLLLVRVAGRRVFGQWTPLDIVVAIVTGSTLSRALTGNADLFGTLAATTLVMTLHWAVSRACARWPGLSRWLEGPAVRLAVAGQWRREALLRHAVSEAAVAEALRRAGVESVAATRLVVLEPSGNISVLRDRGRDLPRS